MSEVIDPQSLDILIHSSLQNGESEWNPFLLIYCRRAYYLVSQYASHRGEVGLRPDSLPLWANFKSEWSPSPKWCLFPWYRYEFTDLNMFDTGRCIAIIMLVAADRSHLWPVGTFSIWLLSPFDTTVSHLCQLVFSVVSAVTFPLLLLTLATCGFSFFFSWVVSVFLFISSKN